MANLPIPMRQATRKPRLKLVHQLLVVLSGTDPLVWRRIQVPWLNAAIGGIRVRF